MKLRINLRYMITCSWLDVYIYLPLFISCGLTFDPQEVALVQSIETHTGVKMAELELEDERVAEILVQVSDGHRHLEEARKNSSLSLHWTLKPDTML